MKDPTEPNIDEEIGGPKYTFEITVNRRQDTPLQGRIVWVEKNMDRDFSSILEMLRLMDEAMINSEAQSDQFKWVE